MHEVAGTAPDLVAEERFLPDTPSVGVCDAAHSAICNLHSLLLLAMLVTTLGLSTYTVIFFLSPKQRRRPLI